MYQRKIYDTIPFALSDYNILGSTTPSTLEIKLNMLGPIVNSPTAIILFDAFRCSSTILACFSSGIDGAFIMEKGSNVGVSITEATEFVKRSNNNLVFGGELDGKPISNGFIGNSPVNGCNYDELHGKILHFQSTNLGKTYTDTIRLIRLFKSPPDIFVTSFLNAEATSNYINSHLYEKIYVGCSGFYDCIALEDMILGGEIISKLSIANPKYDDDALAMLACFQNYRNQVVKFHECWTGNVLRRLSKEKDIDDILNMGAIPDTYRETMKSLVLKVVYTEGQPMIKKIH